MSNRTQDLVLVALAGLLLWYSMLRPVLTPCKPEPANPPPPAKVGPPAEAKVGGKVAPDGKTEIQCDLPGDQHCKNISSKGQGCCVQTSINHSARWQNVPALINFHEWVKEKGLPGGAYPGAVDDRIPKCCKDRGYPAVSYVQIEGSKDLAMLKLACSTGRMPGVTYSKSPTGRYGGSQIAHMVSMPHCDDKLIAILDNNYPGSAGKEDTYEWISPEEFIKVCNPQGYWAVILLPPSPSPVPHN